MAGTVMTQDELEEKISAFQRHQQLQSMLAEKSRAKTVSVGNAGCGVVEITLRGIDGSHLFAQLHPAEVVEHIHACAAMAGLHIHLRPRDDFASHREWKELTEEDRQHLNGWAPFPQLDVSYNAIGGAYLPMGRPFHKQETPGGLAADQHENE